MSTQTRHEKAQHTDIMSEGVARRLAAIGHIPTGAAREVIASHETLRAQVAHLTAQRDALLTACGKLADQADFIDLHILQNDLRGYRLLREVQEARQAIAQATGNGQ